MATRADQLKALTERANSAARRAAQPKPHPTKTEQLRAALEQSPKGRALHAPTKLRADAKALKPNPGPVAPFWKTGINGGEEQTRNGVSTGRGADGPARIPNASRKSTRGEWPGGEKDGRKARTQKMQQAVSPEMRARRKK